MIFYVMGCTQEKKVQISDNQNIVVDKNPWVEPEIPKVVDTQPSAPVIAKEGFDYILVQGLPVNGTLFFVCQVNNYDSEQYKASAINEGYSIQSNIVCKGKTTLYKTKLNFNYDHKIRFINIDQNFCQTGKIVVTN
jgi:hypothetical protein